MGYEDRGETKVGTKFTQRCAHVLSQVDVKARKRFIEQQQRRPMYQRPRESRALLLAPGQLVRIAGGIVAIPEVGGLHHRYDRIAA